MLLSLLVLAITTPLLCLAQGNGVIIEKLPLDKNPEVSRQCPKNKDWLNEQWIDDNTILVRYRVSPCQGIGSFKFGNTALDMHGKTIASLDTDLNTQFLHTGPYGEALLVTYKHSVQVLDGHFAILKTIDCADHDCNAFLSADRTGFALCNYPYTDYCRYFRGQGAEDANLDNFPDGFPELDKFRQASSKTNQPTRYSVNGDLWFFDRKGHVFRVKGGGKQEELPSPAASILDENCVAKVSEETHNRVLVHCSGGFGFGDEMVLYGFDRLLLYDAASGKVLCQVGAGNDPMSSVSPDGKRIAVVRGDGQGSRSSVTIYYVP